MRLKGIIGTFMVLAALSVVALAAAPPARQAIVSWGAVTTDVEGHALSGITYTLYRGAHGTGTSGKAAIQIGLTALTFTDGNRPAGVTECYNVTAVAAGIESDPSAEGCKSYPGAQPSAVPSINVQ